MTTYEVSYIFLKGSQTKTLELGSCFFKMLYQSEASLQKAAALTWARNGGAVKPLSWSGPCSWLMLFIGKEKGDRA